MAARLSVVALIAVGCSSDGGDDVAATGTVPPASASSAAAHVLSAEDYSPSRFGEGSATIDNPWFPMTPGSQLIYKGRSGVGRERLGHGVVFTVTDLTKVIDGVRTILLWEEDYTEGELVETELAFFAQDQGGNVWHFGQYPEEYEEGKFVKAPAWIAGVEGARTGITMKAEPKLGTPDYSQGFAPKPINWIDRARVREVGVHTCVPAGCYEDVLVTEEFEVDKPGAFQLKYYAHDVGTVRVGWAGRNEDEREVLVLTEAKVLSPEELAEVREQVLALEARAYDVSPDVYGTTPPLAPLTS
jgi:hypothetical protein